MEESFVQNSALVVIDLQNDITKNYREIIENVNAAIDRAVQEGLWVVYIRHNNLSDGARTFKPGTHGAELVPEMKVVSDHIFTKSKSSALTNEKFAAFIQENGIDEFYIAGADAAACVKSTCYNMTKAVIPFMCCRTASRATTKRRCQSCLRITKARDAPLRRFAKPCRRKIPETSS